MKFQISLAAARVNANMTQEDTAKAMKVSKTTVVNWEKGKVIPGIPEVEMMSRLYGIPQDYIFLLPFRNCVPSEYRAINMQKEGVISPLPALFLRLPALSE